MDEQDDITSSQKLLGGIEIWIRCLRRFDRMSARAREHLEGE